MIDKLKENIPPIHREGFVFILISLAVTLFFFMFSEVLGLLMSIVSTWCICFFRDPERVVPESKNLVVSPADGRVCAIVKDAIVPKEFNMIGSYNRVSIFLNIFNVHVNRMPIAGKITKLKYHKGKFFNASLDKASVHNERQYVQCKNEELGLDLLVVQIAGLIARRIVCDLNQDQEVEAGERFGIIRFGSRVDLYLPDDIPINVKMGQTMIGGETVLCDLNNRKVGAKKLAERKAPAAAKVVERKKSAAKKPAAKAAGVSKTLSKTKASLPSKTSTKDAPKAADKQQDDE